MKVHLTLTRDGWYDNTTVGGLAVNGKPMFTTLEDTARAYGVKIPGKTCIPEGEYYVKISMSHRFKRRMPMIYTEPNEYEIVKGGIGFKGVRIHRGNTHEHTHGCILVGMGVNGATITESRKAEAQLMAILEEATEITLTVINKV